MARVVVDIPVVATAGGGRGDAHNDGRVGVVTVIPGVVAAVVIVDHCCHCRCGCLPIKSIDFQQLDEANSQGLENTFAS